MVVIFNDVNAEWLFYNVVTGICWHDSWFIKPLQFLLLWGYKKGSKRKLEGEIQVVIQFYVNWKVYSEETVGCTSVSKDFVRD